MLSLRVCAEPGCPHLQAESRCLTHRRAREQARGTKQQRGYDSTYDSVGRDYQRRMDAGERFDCWRCGIPLGTKRGIDWTLGHDDHDRSVIRGPECPSCQYATAGRNISPEA